MKETTRNHSSVQPRKQRRAMFQAPLHVRRKHLSAHLAEELIVQYKRRAFPLRKGDTVKVVRGDDKGTTGEVLTVDAKAYRVTVNGVTVKKSNGTEVARPVHASNLIITRLLLSDPKRRAALERKGIKVKAPPEAKPQAAKKKEPPRLRLSLGSSREATPQAAAKTKEPRTKEADA